MNVHATETVIGMGSAASSLLPNDLRAIVEEALGNIQRGERVLAIIPDRTRDDNTDLLFPMAAQFLARRNVAQFDALVAQGTHGPMTEAQKLAKIGAGSAEVPGLGRIFDHRWDNSDELVTLRRCVAALSDRGQEHQAHVFDYRVRLLSYQRAPSNMSMVS